MMKNWKLAGVVGLALLTPALALAGNIPKKPSITAAVSSGDFITTGTQVVTTTCQSVTVNVAGYITGNTDDGGGLDKVLFELWDDGTLKDSAEVAVPVGQTRPFNVTMQFAGLYQTGAAGVGVYAEEVGFYLDPFYPEDIDGTCSMEKIKCWISPSKVKPGGKVGVFAEIPGGATGVQVYQGDILQANLTDPDGDDIYFGSFVWPLKSTKTGWKTQFAIRAMTPQGEVWCPGVQVVP